MLEGSGLMGVRGLKHEMMKAYLLFLLYLLRAWGKLRQELSEEEKVHHQIQLLLLLAFFCCLNQGGGRGCISKWVAVVWICCCDQKCTSCDEHFCMHCICMLYHFLLCFCHNIHIQYFPCLLFWCWLFQSYSSFLLTLFRVFYAVHC